LSRGAGLFSRDRTYLEEVTRRTARQILTAGGADQLVSDEGPDGHSVFTWALLQGLQGQADLDGNGVITASELGAYISPIVSQFAKQTPTVGNFVGSEGGEFLFELQPEPLTSMTKQLDGQALRLNDQLSSLQKEIVVKQEELLRLQQSIQAESVRLAQVTTQRGAAGSPTKSSANRAYDLDRQGLQLYKEKQYQQAEQKFKAAAALKPRDPVLLNNLGYIYYVMGRNGEALTYLEKTLSLDPRRKEAQGNIAELYLKLGRREEAKKHYEEYLILYPASPKAEEFRRILQSLN
jgi:tetratricopeptide (TPR) repeat protein